MAKRKRPSQTFHTDAGDRRRPSLPPLDRSRVVDKTPPKPKPPLRERPIPQTFRTDAADRRRGPSVTLKTYKDRPRTEKKAVPYPAAEREGIKAITRPWEAPPLPRRQPAKRFMDLPGVGKPKGVQPLSIHDMSRLAPVSSQIRTMHAAGLSPLERTRLQMRPKRHERFEEWGDRAVTAASFLPLGLGDVIKSGDNAFANDLRNNLAGSVVGFMETSDAVMKGIQSVTSGFGIRASGGGFTTQRAEGAEDYPFQTAVDVAKRSGVGFGQSVESIIPFAVQPRSAYEALLRGDIDAYVEESKKDPGRSADYITTYPVTSFLTLSAFVAPEARMVSYGTLFRRVARLNPGLSSKEALRAAVKESHNPGFLAANGMKGGMTRTRHVEVVGADGTVKRTASGAPARPLKRTPIGRSIQRTGDAISKRLPDRLPITPGGYSVKVPLTQSRRAAADARRARRLRFTRRRNEIVEESRALEGFLKGNKYLPTTVAAMLSSRLEGVQARMAAVTMTAHGSDPVHFEETIRAAITELEQIRDTGLKNIPSDETIELTERFDSLRQKMVAAGFYPDTETGMWAQARNALYEVGHSTEEVEAQIAGAAMAASAWAVKTGNDPSDFLVSPEGADIAGIHAGIPDVDADAAFLRYQRLGWNPALIQRAPREPMVGDMLSEVNGPTDWQIQSINPELRRVEIGDYHGLQASVSLDELDQFSHRGLRPGEQVMLDTGEEVEVVDAAGGRAGTFTAKAIDGDDTYEVPITKVELPDVSPFQHKAPTILSAEMPNKASPDQILALLKKHGVSAAEIDWSGLGDWLAMEKARRAGTKQQSLTRQEVLDWLNDDSPFTLNEVLLKPGQQDRQLHTRWQEYTTRQDDPNYRELVVTLGGKEQFRHGHWAGIKNPVVHIRFTEDTDTNTVYIHEFQADWQRQAHEAGRTIPRDVTSEEWKARIQKANADYTAFEIESRRKIGRLLGLEPGQGEYGERGYVGWEQTNDPWPANQIVSRLTHDLARSIDADIDRIYEKYGGTDAFPRHSNLRNEEVKRRMAIQKEQSPEWQRLGRIEAAEKRLRDQSERLRMEASTMTQAVRESPLGGKNWRQFVLKRMVAYAARNDFDTVAWDTGLTQAIRNGKIDPGEELGFNLHYEEPDVSEGPDAAEYEYPVTEARYEFTLPSQPRFAQLDIWGNDDPNTMVRAGLMDEVMDQDSLDLADEDWENLDSFKYIDLEHLDADHPLSGQLAEIVRFDGDTVTLRPSMIKNIAIEGRGYLGDGSTGTGDIWVRDWQGQTVESVNMEGYIDDFDHLAGDSPFIQSVMPGRWSDDLNSDLSNSTEYVLDDEAYENAVADWRESYEEEQYGSGGATEDINTIEANPESTGLVNIYDKRFPEDAEKLFGKYGAKVEKGQRTGRYSDLGSWRSEEGPIDVWEMKLTDELRDAANKGQTVFQRTAEGEIQGATEFLLGQNGRRLIWLAQGSDPSTFFHELLGHAPHELRDRFPDLWEGVEATRGKPYAAWTVKDEEWFARHVDRYMAEGISPAPEMTPFLAQMKKFLKDVWERIKLMAKTPVPDEVRTVLDAYFGAEKVEMTDAQFMSLERLRDRARELERQGASDLADVQWAMVSRLRHKIEQENTTVFGPEEKAQLVELGTLMQRRFVAIERDRQRMENLSDAQILEEGETLIDAANGDPEADAALDPYVDEMRRRRAGAEGWGQSSAQDRMINQQIEKLEQGITEAKNKEGEFAEALGAVVSISDQAERLLMDEVLSMVPGPQRTAVEQQLLRRRNLLQTRWREMGLLPYPEGDEPANALAYIPHVDLFEHLLNEANSARTGAARLPAGARRVVGKTQVPRSALRKGKNKGILWQSGAMSMNPRSLMNTVLSRLRVAETAEARDLAWEMGVPVRNARDASRLPADWFVINREGKKVPTAIEAAMDMTDEQYDAMVASGKDFDSKIETREGMDSFLGEYIDSFMRRADDIPSDWWQRGETSSELRALPPEIMSRMLTKPFAARGGAFWAIANSLVRAAVIFGYPLGYLMTNVPANATLLMLTNPVGVMRAMPEALALRKSSMFGKDNGLFRRITTETGSVQATSGAPDFYARPGKASEKLERGVTGVVSGASRALGEVSDQPFRAASWIGYARRYGYKTREDWEKLLTDPELEHLRNDIGQRAREDMIDFDSLTDFEKERIARFFFLWPLVKGMAKWPLHFAMDHPYISAAGAQFGTEREQKESGYAVGGLAKDRSIGAISLMPVGKDRAVDLRSLNPLGGIESGLEIDQSLNAALQAHDLPGTVQGISNFLLPPISEALSPYGSFKDLAETTIPGYGYVKDRSSKLWPDRSRSNYWKTRNIRLGSQRIDWNAAKGFAEREQRQRTGETATGQRLDREQQKMRAFVRKAGYTPEQTANLMKQMRVYWKKEADWDSDWTDTEKATYLRDLLMSTGAEVAPPPSSALGIKDYITDLNAAVNRVHSDLVRGGILEES